MKFQELKNERKINDIQLTPVQLKIISDTLKGGCNFLVFGVGNDSSFWLKANKNGKTIFIEDDKNWLEEVKQKCPGINIYFVDYQTKLSDNWKLLDSPEKLSLELSDEIKNTKWDVILVDAPRGYQDDQPGRMKSIYEASVLIKNGGYVFVHDCDRSTEKTYSDKYLLSSNLVTEFSILRQYLVSNNTIFHKIKLIIHKVYGEIIKKYAYFMD